MAKLGSMVATGWMPSLSSLVYSSSDTCGSRCPRAVPKLSPSHPLGHNSPGKRRDPQGSHCHPQMPPPRGGVWWHCAGSGCPSSCPRVTSPSCGTSSSRWPGGCGTAPRSPSCTAVTAGGRGGDRGVGGDRPPKIPPTPQEVPGPHPTPSHLIPSDPIPLSLPHVPKELGPHTCPSSRTEQGDLPHSPPILGSLMGRTWAMLMPQ